MIRFLKYNKAAGQYISSGLLKVIVNTISGFIILRWIDPVELGKWQSFTVFVSYLQILTLGVTSGLNRELPYLIGKGDEELGIKRLKTAGYFTTVLSLSVIVSVIIVGIILCSYEIVSIDDAIMLMFAFSTGALTIQTNFLGATYRSSQSFTKLSKIQFLNSILYFILIPFVYFFNIWGYVLYQVALGLFLYWGYQYYRPYKIKYTYSKKQLIELVKIGLPIYFWNYLASVSRTIPRLLLVLFASPYLVGLYSPAGSVNAAMLNLPAYLNRYLFPKMAFMFGQSNDLKKIFKYSIKSARMLFAIMIIGAIVACFAIPPTFNMFFPKYAESILAAQITVFSGVFYSVNALFHNALNSINVNRYFRFIVILRFTFILLFSALAFAVLGDLLLAVSIGALLAEMFNSINYFICLRKACLIQ